MVVEKYLCIDSRPLKGWPEIVDAPGVRLNALNLEDLFIEVAR